MDFASLFTILNFVLLALGFGFVIFWHELGHFLAAKWAKVRVDQFAIGFGNAIFSWRKGLGLRRGTSAPEYEAIKTSDPAKAVEISPTEYRLNWLPLGGYVKMLGQEDLAVTSDAHAPDSYQAKTVGQRMIIISAGVVMNVILAGVLFTMLYWIGFSAPASRVGQVEPGSPADMAGIEVGDTIISINGNAMHDFSKVRLGVALLSPDTAAQVVIQPSGTSDVADQETLSVVPKLHPVSGMLAIGVGPTPSLTPRADVVIGEEGLERERLVTDPQVLALVPGDTVVSVDGTPVAVGDYAILHEALVEAGNADETVSIRVKGADGTERDETIRPEILYGNANVFAGFEPLLHVRAVTVSSPLAPGSERDKAGEAVLRPGDVLLKLTLPKTGDALDRPTIAQLTEWLNQAGQQGDRVTLTVQRDGEIVELADLPLTSLGGGWISRLFGNARYGLGAYLPPYMEEATLASSVIQGSPADRAGLGELVSGLPGGTVRVVAVDGVEVSSWLDVSRELRAGLVKISPTTRPSTVPDESSKAATGMPVTLEFTTAAGELSRETRVIELTSADAEAITQIAWGSSVGLLQPGSPTVLESIRETRNPLQAVWWGVFETRDQIANLYLTLRRVIFDQTVSASNLSGPVGILHFGTIVAAKGPTWLLWFLAMLSANLAVVNFLPIPILDGGHMVFLLWEKISGKAPPRAVQEGALWVGLAFLGCFILFVTFNDISRLVTF